jgi:hypothetical protein
MITLEQFNAYLPYDLKLSVWGNDFKCKLSAVDFEDESITISYPRMIDNCRGEIISYHDGENRGHDCYIHNCKPLLHHLIDFDRVIEHNGKEFIMSEHLECLGYKLKEEDFREELKQIPHGAIQLMLKYHFDIFNLIDLDLAININKLAPRKTIVKFL